MTRDAWINWNRGTQNPDTLIETGDADLFLSYARNMIDRPLPWGGVIDCVCNLARFEVEKVVEAILAQRAIHIAVAVKGGSMDLQSLREFQAANRAAGRDENAGLRSAQIGRLSRAMMFGDNDEAFPSAQEWARVVD